jgi:hypothetical protein
MDTVYFDSAITDESRRQRLYQGSLFVFSPSPSSVAMCDFARELIREEFGRLDPLEAQYHLPVEEYAAILSRLKPRFIHHPRSKEYIQGILEERGCDLTTTYFDVPRLRSSTSDNYLTTGIAYAWHPHRDTWYSAPPCQLNWWFPVFEMGMNDGIAFHCRYWNQAVENDSHRYNYYVWNEQHRDAATSYIKSDPRPLPRPLHKIEMDSQILPVLPVGSIVLFSAAQLHSSVPNTSGKTRFSIDFRTVHFGDVLSKTGAPNIDSQCTGTSLRDFLRGSDFSRLPEDVVALYNDGTETTGKLIYQHG